MPIITFSSLEEVPEGLREFAKTTDGKVVVNVVPEVKLAEFRDNNIRISQERDAAVTTLAKVKPAIGENIEEFLARQEALRTLEQQVKDGKLQGTDAIQAEVDNRVATMKSGYESQLSAKAQEAQTWQQKAAEADTKFNRAIIERAVTEAVIDAASGALPSALPDLITRANNVFRVGPDGKLIAKDGEATIYGSDGATPMTPSEWLVKLRSTAPYFFKNSSGGGANGGTGSGASFGGMSKEDFGKLSPQARLSLYHQEQARKAGRR